jgi:hypothetical protein
MRKKTNMGAGKPGLLKSVFFSKPYLIIHFPTP